jgi:hypothetical protein
MRLSLDRSQRGDTEHQSVLGAAYAATADGSFAANPPCPTAAWSTSELRSTGGCSRKPTTGRFNRADRLEPSTHHHVGVLKTLVGSTSPTSRSTVGHSQSLQNVSLSRGSHPPHIDQGCAESARPGPGLSPGALLGSPVSPRPRCSVSALGRRSVSALRVRPEPVSKAVRDHQEPEKAKDDRRRSPNVASREAPHKHPLNVSRISAPRGV